jgi:hypothetical protein
MVYEAIADNRRYYADLAINTAKIQKIEKGSDSPKDQMSEDLKVG